MPTDAATRPALAKINADQRLYVVDCGEGYTCLGFDVAFKWASDVRNWLAAQGVIIDAPDAAKIGTPEGYADYSRVMAAGSAWAADTNRRCPAQLTPELRGKEGQRVEVLDCYGERRRFTVGRSTGWLPIHLELRSGRSSGGGAVTGAPFRSVRVL